jgi:hypothetical protein
MDTLTWQTTKSRGTLTWQRPNPGYASTWLAAKSTGHVHLAAALSRAHVDLAASQVHESPGLVAEPQCSLEETQRVGLHPTRRSAIPRRVVLQPARVDMHPSPGYAASARGFPDLGAQAYRPARMGLQPGVRASPYHPGLGRPSARCLKLVVAARHADLA